jgi:hypothetical protein
VPSVRLPLAEDEKVLLAATIERWIVQLTSSLDYDELLNFFLTYRNYVKFIHLSASLDFAETFVYARSNCSLCGGL